MSCGLWVVGHELRSVGVKELTETRNRRSLAPHGSRLMAHNSQSTCIYPVLPTGAIVIASLPHRGGDMSVYPGAVTSDSRICAYCGAEMGPPRMNHFGASIVRDCLRCGARWMNATWLAPLFPVKKSVAA